ncbi:hypothetical protein [Celeribacter halophilus]|uniref:hypothetical protein n=1 Tax=Celeribacter halophilus TaxID=576117 RepID=UPI003A918E1D
MKTSDHETGFLDGSPAAKRASRITDAQIEQLAQHWEVTPAKEELRKYFRYVGLYAEMSLENDKLPGKKETRRQIEALRKASRKFSDALEKLHGSYQFALQDTLEEPELDELFRLNPEEDFLEEEPELKTIQMEALQSHVKEIQNWTEKKLEELDQAPTALEQQLGSSLDQTIIYLAAIFNKYNSRPAKSLCYYDGSQNNYAGKFFVFVKEFLDECVPNSYFSEGALGKRITRVLAKDIWGKL